MRLSHNPFACIFPYETVCNISFYEQLCCIYRLFCQENAIVIIPDVYVCKAQLFRGNIVVTYHMDSCWAMQYCVLLQRRVGSYLNKYSQDQELTFWVMLIQTQYLYGINSLLNHICLYNVILIVLPVLLQVSYLSGHSHSVSLKETKNSVSKIYLSLFAVKTR